MSTHNTLSSHDNAVDPGSCMSEWGQRIKLHALSHYEFGWDSVIECLCDRDLEDFAVEYRTQGGDEAGLIPAAAEHFGVSATVVQPEHWVVVSRDVDGASVQAFDAEADARHRFADMLGRPAPEGFRLTFKGVSGFGTEVTIHRPKASQGDQPDATAPQDATSASPVVTRAVVVLGGASMGPVFHTTHVRLTQAEADAGLHYETAKLAGLEAGLEEPLIAFDQFDPATCQLMHIATEMTALRESYTLA